MFKGFYEDSLLVKDTCLIVHVVEDRLRVMLSFVQTVEHLLLLTQLLVRHQQK